MHIGITAMGGGGASSGVAVALPAASADNALFFASDGSTSRLSGVDIGIPAGDWTLGFALNIPTDTKTGVQTLLGIASSSSNPYSTANTMSVCYLAQDGSLTVHGLDGSSNSLGQHKPHLPDANVNSYALAARHPILPGSSVWVFVVKTGSFAQLWLKFDGHAPVKSAESFTSMGAITATSWFVGVGRDSSNTFKGKMRNLFKVSYALTKAQMDAVGNGTDPTTLGTPAGNDFRYLLAANTSTQTSTINALTLTRTFDHFSVVTGVGLAPQTDAVFLDPLGADGYVVQHYNGVASVALSGTYIGASGGDIEAQVIDQDGVCFQGWRTVATGISGGTWSGSLDVPKGKRWVRVQLRKKTIGVASSDVMTTSLRWGVGENIILIGQSLQAHMEYTATLTKYSAAAPHYGSSTVTPNGFISTLRDISAQVTYANSKQFSITGIADNGSGKCRVTVSGRHGLENGEVFYILGVVGTTEVNGVQLTATVISRTVVDVQVAFVHAYTSGGVGYPWKASWTVFNPTWDLTPDGHVILANAISNMVGCTVCISNQAVGGQAIEQFNAFNYSSGINNFGATSMLAARSMRGVGTVLWLHGHQNLGQTAYFMDSGSWGTETGYGSMGTLYEFYKANLPNSNPRFGVAGFHSITGKTNATPDTVNSFRRAFKRWVERKNAAGDNNVFFTGWYHDLENQVEDSLTQYGHLIPLKKGYLSQAARQGAATALKLLSQQANAVGPSITSATRSGAVINLTITHTAGSDIQWARMADGSIPSGFEVATATSFASPLAISNIQRISATQLRITLASDPGATCYVRYQYGLVGVEASNTYITAKVNGVADNGAGLIRITCDNVSVTPANSQKASSGHMLTGGEWIGIVGVKGATQANGIWKALYVNATQFDLEGSSSAGLGTFVNGQNLWQTAASGVVSVEVAVPVYDNQTVGGYDTTGQPLQPTETYVTAA